MRDKVWPSRLAGALLIVALPVLLVATPLYLFVRPGFVHQQYARPGFPASWRFDRVERTRLSDVILRYLQGRASVEAMATMRTDAGDVALLPEETQHLVDVRRVMDDFFAAQAVAAAVTALCLLALWFGPERWRIPQALRRGVTAVFALMALVLVSSFIDFDAFFTLFHQLFFRAGSWTFYEEDTLIQLYPLPLWMSTVAWVAGTIVIESLAVLAVAVGLRRVPALQRPRP